MPITVVSTQRKFLSDVVKGANTFENANAMQFNFDGIVLTSENNVGVGVIPTATVEPMGIPVIYDSVTNAWVIYNTNDEDIAAAITANDSTLPDHAPIAVVVGNKFGVGFNPEDVTLDVDGGAAPITVVAFFRGANNAGVVFEGIDFTAGGVTTGDQAAFRSQLEKQGIMVIDNAEVITPSFTD